jgi:hypothetical protein
MDARTRTPLLVCFVLLLLSLMVCTCSSGQVSSPDGGGSDAGVDGAVDDAGSDGDADDAGADGDAEDAGVDGDGGTADGDVSDGGSDGGDIGGDDPSDPSEVTLHAAVMAGGGDPLLVSNGVPFAPGTVFSSEQMALFDGDGEISVHVAPLAFWQDGSLRSVLLQFERPAAAFPATLTLKLGQTRSLADRGGTPVVWVLPQAVAFPDGVYLAASFVAGPLVEVGAQPWMADYDDRQRQNYDTLKGDADWGPDCRYDGYYSTAHAWYQLFARSGDSEVYSWARREAVHYRDDQIIGSGADAGTMNGRSEPRYLFQKAMETDYLLSGDARTRDVARLMADYVLASWDPDFFFFAHDDARFWTERRAAFALMGLVVYGRFSGEQAYLTAAAPRLEQLLATQAEWPDGGFIHHLYSHDTEECSTEGSYGGSPFMTGLMFEALIAHHEWFADGRIVSSVVAACDWLWDGGWAGDGFTYMIGCPGESDWSAPDLNLLIAHGFAFAWHHTGEVRFYVRAMTIFEQGVENAYLGTRKHYNQNHRSSGSFLYYMTQGPPP